MKHAKIFLFLVIFLLVGFGAYEFVDRVVLARKILAIPNPNAEFRYPSAPDFQLIDTEGRPISPDLFRGKVVLVHFWASWCPPCVEEFPSLVKFVESFRGQVILLALSNDYADREMRHFISRYKFNKAFVHVAWDADHRIADIYGTRRLPETYVFDGNLKLISKIPKAQDWTDPGLRQKVQEWVRKP